MYQVKAFVRSSKAINRAASASEALRLLREMQSRSGVTYWGAFKNGVLVSQSELESSIRKEKGLNS
ncbi:hypothetical protein ASE66_19255 [Bosea sp. Root483D1]|nr:hypothetical protein ASE66_19255 [Bosea sp. Root483D1]